MKAVKQARLPLQENHVLYPPIAPRSERPYKNSRIVHKAQKMLDQMDKEQTAAFDAELEYVLSLERPLREHAFLAFALRTTRDADKVAQHDTPSLEN